MTKKTENPEGCRPENPNVNFFGPEAIDLFGVQDAATISITTFDGRTVSFFRRGANITEIDFERPIRATAIVNVVARTIVAFRGSNCIIEHQCDANGIMRQYRICDGIPEELG
jgi:hypothetical protein